MAEQVSAPAGVAVGAGASPATVCDAFLRTVDRARDRPALRVLDGVELSWGEYADQVRQVAAFLADRGIGRGDVVALLLTNRPEFHVLDLAALFLGATPVSLYNTAPAEQLAHVVQDTGARLLVTEEALAEQAERLRDTGQIGGDQLIVVDRGSFWSVLLGNDRRFDLHAAAARVSPQDLATLIYTSGTTGPPKGVQVTHANMAFMVEATDPVLGIRPDSEIISYLPMAHVAERLCTHYVPIRRGTSVVCCPSPAEAIAHLGRVRPDWFFAPPRVWEKLRTAITGAIGGLPDAQRESARAALDAGLEVVRSRRDGTAVDDAVEDRRRAGLEGAFPAIRQRLGLDRVRVAAVGAAPCPQEVVEFFHAIGIPLIEGLGMTECSGVVSMNPVERAKPGTVGPPLPGVEARLAPDAELLVRGPLVTPGYHGRPDATAEAIDSAGWLSTGDIAQIDEDGYITIVDRKKEIIVNASGKNMSPTLIEGRITTSCPLVAQAFVHGNGRPYNVALLTLDGDAMRAFAERRGIAGATFGDLVAAPGVLDAVRAGVEQANATLSRVEQIKHFAVMPDEWLPGGDELTPTMKLRRRQIVDKHGPVIDGLYGG